MEAILESQSDANNGVNVHIPASSLSGRREPSPISGALASKLRCTLMAIESGGALTPDDLPGGARHDLSRDS
jgi:hypothetical protein